MLALDDTAIILSVRKHGETSALVDILTKHHGLYKGAVRGAFSKKNRGLYESGNLVAAHWSARIEEHMGNITAEMLMPVAALIMPHPQATSLLCSACALLASSLPERHPYPKLYTALAHLLIHLTRSPESGLSEYLGFELLLLAETGFGLDLEQCVATGTTENLTYISPKSGRAVCADAGEPYKDKLLKYPADLNTTGYFLEHWLYDALGKPLPPARKRLVAS